MVYIFCSNLCQAMNFFNALSTSIDFSVYMATFFMSEIEQDFTA